MNYSRILLTGTIVLATALPSLAQDSKNTYSYTTFKGSKATPQVVQLIEDSTSSRTSFERDIARRRVDNTHIIYPFGEGERPTNEAARDLISIFYENQYRHSQDPLAPYFTFMSRDAKMAMGIGGVIRMRGWYDFNGSIDANGFSPYLIPVPRQDDQKRAIGATPAGTAIFFTILGRDTQIGNYMGYIEANFDGFNHTNLKLKKAYLTINDFTAGYTSSTFSDPAAEPYTIDGSGPNGKMSKTNVLVRYLKTFSQRFSFSGSVEFPSSNISADGIYTKKLKDFSPDLVLMTQYQWDNSLSHVRLAGLFRTVPYRNLVTATNHYKLGWGVQLSAVAKIANPLTLYGITSVGQGHGSYCGDLSIDGNDLLATPGHNGDMYAPTAYSIIAGVKYSFLENLFMSLALSELRSFTKSGSPADTYKYGLYGAANLVWQITPRLQVGGEYLIGKRMNIDGSHGNANRIDAFFQVSF